MIHETAVFFNSCGNELFGILTEPGEGRSTEPVVVLMHEAIPGGMAAQNAVIPRLARALAAAGRASFRFDFHGTGDSGGPEPLVGHAEPFCADLEAALDWLGDLGATRFVLAGSCLGALTAAATAARRADVSAIALMSCSFASDGEERTMLRARKVLRDLRIVIAREVPILFCYGEPDAVYADFCAARGHPLGGALAAPSVSVHVLPGRLHSFLDVDLQERAIALAVAWVESTAVRLDPDARPAGLPRARASRAR